MSEPRLPYGRTHTCGELREADEGKKVKLRGYVGRKLDESTFTLDDGSGRTLVVVSPDANEAARDVAKHLRTGSFLAVSGDVQKRMRASSHLPTGAIAGSLQYTSSCEEIYDVQVLPGQMRPGMVRPDDPFVHESLVLPDQTFLAK